MGRVRVRVCVFCQRRSFVAQLFFFFLRAAHFFPPRKVTLFRFLLDSDDDIDAAHDLLVETTMWRLEHGVDDLHWDQFLAWFEHGFAFYHGHDRQGQPIALIQLRAFPVKAVVVPDLGMYLQNYACTMMEIARRWTLHETRARQSRSDAAPLALELTVVVDLQDAPFVALDHRAVRHLAQVMERHYPFCVGKIFVIHFSWVHQGLWQLLKLLLSEETKRLISFVEKDELLQVVAEDALLTGFGGLDPYVFDPFSDPILQRFARSKMTSDQRLPPSPAPSEKEEDQASVLDEKTQLDSSDSTGHVSPSVLGYFGLSQHQIGLRTGIDHTASFFLPLKTNQLDPHRQPKSAPVVGSYPRHPLSNDMDLYMASSNSGRSSTGGTPAATADHLLSDHINNNATSTSTSTATASSHSNIENAKKMNAPNAVEHLYSVMHSSAASGSGPTRTSALTGIPRASAWKLSALIMLFYVIMRLQCEAYIFDFISHNWTLSHHDTLIGTIGATSILFFLVTPLLACLV
ncbi:CRAL-TRIO domain-containing protein [Gongronella butleri]|nr:CRAL-TRIO domain-containing protein [Gongronella butleri]